MKEYKLIIAGGRDFNDREALTEVTDNLLNGELANLLVSIVSGMAKGADRLGYDYAKAKGLKVYAKYADWDTHGKRAGFIRNAEMAAMADGVLAFWDGKSSGTRHMIDTMLSKKKDVWVFEYNT